ncbi:MAG TPA: hypothetical protein VIK33_10025 [Anaerolineae bacterium]
MLKQALVVHPDRKARILLERWLRAEGYQPQSVSAGADAIFYARHMRIDLIVLDRQAPPSECSDVILGLMTDPKSARIPIAFANPIEGDAPILATSRTIH